MPHQLPAVITLNHIAIQLSNLRGLINKGSHVEFDLSQVQRVDSAGIAMLLELKNVALQENCELKFINSNNVIERLCRLYKVVL